MAILFTVVHALVNFSFRGPYYSIELLQYIISLEVWDRETHILQQDLAGANGWESIEECIQLLTCVRIM